MSLAENEFPSPAVQTTVSPAISSSNVNSTSKIPTNWAQKWTPDEDQRLLQAIDQHGTNWKLVAEVVGTRNAVKCSQRWEKGLKPGIVKGRWTDEEDRTLIYLVSQGHKNWGQVALHMPGRTSKQCRERWNNYLDPTLKHDPFSGEEDVLLVQLQKALGNKWAAIAKLMPGRTENAVKLRYNHIVKSSTTNAYCQELLQVQAQSALSAAALLELQAPAGPPSALPASLTTQLPPAAHVAVAMAAHLPPAAPDAEAAARLAAMSGSAVSGAFVVARRAGEEGEEAHPAKRLRADPDPLPHHSHNHSHNHNHLFSTVGQPVALAEDDSDAESEVLESSDEEEEEED